MTLCVYMCSCACACVHACATYLVQLVGALVRDGGWAAGSAVRRCIVVPAICICVGFRYFEPVKVYIPVTNGPRVINSASETYTRSILKASQPTLASSVIFTGKGWGGGGAGVNAVGSWDGATMPSTYFLHLVLTHLLRCGEPISEITSKITRCLGIL